MKGKRIVTVISRRRRALHLAALLRPLSALTRRPSRAWPSRTLVGIVRAASSRRGIRRCCRARVGRWSWAAGALGRPRPPSRRRPGSATLGVVDPATVDAGASAGPRSCTTPDLARRRPRTRPRSSGCSTRTCRPTRIRRGSTTANAARDRRRHDVVVDCTNDVETRTCRQRRLRRSSAMPLVSAVSTPRRDGWPRCSRPDAPAIAVVETRRPVGSRPRQWALRPDGRSSARCGARGARAARRRREEPPTRRAAHRRG